MINLLLVNPEEPAFLDQQSCSLPKWEKSHGHTCTVRKDELSDPRQTGSASTAVISKAGFKD